MDLLELVGEGLPQASKPTRFLNDIKFGFLLDVKYNSLHKIPGIKHDTYDVFKHKTL